MPRIEIQRLLEEKRRRRESKHLLHKKAASRLQFLTDCGLPWKTWEISCDGLSKNVLEKGFIIACQNGCTATAMRLSVIHKKIDKKKGIMAAVEYEQYETAKKLLN
jgi:hypothetical protein